MVEQLPFKEMVAGSTPAGRTDTEKSPLLEIFLIGAGRSDVFVATKTASQGRGNSFVTTNELSLTTSFYYANWKQTHSVYTPKNVASLNLCANLNLE